MKRGPSSPVLALGLALAFAATTASASVEAIIGKWTAKAVTPTGPLELELEIKLEGSQLVGTMAGFQGSVPLSNLKFEDPNLSLEVNLAGATFKLTGVLKDGRFDGKYEQVGADFRGTWTAERKAATLLTGGISGVWNSVAGTPNGDLALKLELKNEGETVIGTLGSDMGTVPLQAASFKDNMLQFNVEIGGNNYHVEATLAENKFTGKWSAVGGTDTGAFTATRQGPPAGPPASESVANLGGTWLSTASTPDGNTITFDLELTQTGETVNGNAISPEGKIPIQKGAFAKNTFSFEIEFGGATYRIQAELAGGKLAGKWSALSSPETGAWSAVRKQP